MAGDANAISGVGFDAVADGGDQESGRNAERDHQRHRDQQGDEQHGGDIASFHGKLSHNDPVVTNAWAHPLYDRARLVS